MELVFGFGRVWLVPMTVAVIVVSALLPDETAAGTCPEPESIEPCECSYSSAADEGRISVTCLKLEGLHELKRVMNSADFGEDPFPSLYVGLSRLGDLSEPGIFGRNRFDYVGLDSSNVTAISADTFAGMEDVVVDLSVYGNLLTDFPYEIIPRFRKLARLSIGSNPIAELRPIASDSLVTLAMDGTDIREIPADFLTAAPNVETLNAYWSRTQVLRDGLGGSMPSMYDLFLGGNGIVDVEPTALHFNSPQLFFIDLSNNNIASIPAGGIKGTIPDAWLVLSSNRIEIMAENVFREPLELMVTSDGTMSIDDNPIACDCSVAWFARSSDALKRRVFGTCADGETRLSDLNADDFGSCP